jgi:hypothetical protein
MNKRPLLYVTRDHEMGLIEKLMYEIDDSAFHPDDTCMLVVSPDYSCIIGQVLIHAWTKDGEIIHPESVHVPYPDESAEPFIERFREEFARYKDQYTKFVLVEAGIIRGGNWTWLVNTMIDMGIDKSNITTIALFENVHSIYQSDYVGQYYDNNQQDLTFWWERPNKHWDQ